MIRRIDMETDPRRAQFAHFRTFTNPYAAVTSDCDITPLYRVTKARGLPFFLTALHCAVNAANAVPELRRRISGADVVEYDVCLSSHTVALPDGTYCYCVLDCTAPLEAFLPYAQAEVERAKRNPTLEDGAEAGQLFFVTSLPWIRFTAVSHPTTFPADSNPRITFGRYFEEGDTVRMPVDLTVHHALADGIHIAKFFEGFQERIFLLR